MDFHVFTSHSRGADDGTPLQMISLEQLEAYRRIEAEYLKLLQHREVASMCACGQQNRDFRQFIGDHTVTDKTQEIKGI